MLNDPLFRQFFGRGFDRPREQRQHGLGSGVIVSPDGYILTNNHVVEGSSDITVTLHDRREIKAKVIGTDPLSDVAVLQVAEKNLPVLPLSDSSRVQVGDFCLAIGDPFALGQTVTFGIISATGRAGLGIENYEDFIQTDASINPGNSGGALINTRGELVGINTAILSGSGGNQGIGFAIPINMANAVMQQILKTGKVTRGYLGITLQPVTPAISQAMGLKEAGGVLINSVEPNGPAAGAGLQRGDVILSANGKPVGDLNSFRLTVSQMPPGSNVSLHVLRNGAPRDVSVKLGELPKQSAQSNDEGGDEGGASLSGVEVDNLTPDIAQQLQVPANTKGVVVTNVGQASNAYDAGLRQGDIIQEVNRQPVTSTQDFDRLVRAAGNKSVLLLVNRGGQTAYVAVESSH
jgi:serine protease Do